MPNINEIWVRPVIQYTKNIVFFTMLITSIITSNILGFIVYFISYQMASILRVGVYNIVLPTLIQSTPLSYPIYDFFDISTFITGNKIPQVIYLPLFAIAYTMAFIIYTALKKQMVMPQIVISSLCGIFLVGYLLTIYMVVSPFQLLPYVEILSGFGIGLLINYIISIINYTALFFASTSTRRKKLICRQI